MQRVGSRHGYDLDLPAGPLANLGPIGVREDVEFSDRVHTQQLTAGSEGQIGGTLHVRSNVVDPIHQIAVLFPPSARYREEGRSCGGYALVSLGGIEVDYARVERQKLIEAPPVQRQIFYLLFIHQA